MSNSATIADAFIEAIASRVVEKLREEGGIGAPATQRKLLDIKTAAEYMDRSASSVRHLVNTGMIPARAVKRMGKRVFLIREELDRWLEAR